MPADIGGIAVYGVAPMKSMRPGRQSILRPRTLSATPPRLNRKAVLGGLVAIAVLVCGAVIVEFMAAGRVETAAKQPAPTVMEASQATSASQPEPESAPQTPEAPPVAAKAGRLMVPTPGEAGAGLSATLPYPDAQRFAQSGPMETGPAKAGLSPPAAARPPAIGPDERETVAAADRPVTGIVGTADDSASSSRDGTATASIASNTAEPNEKVEVAETEAEVAKLEMSIGMVDGQAATAPQSGAQPLPPLTTARVTKYVNLRDGPADEAKVVAVIPANAEIKVETGCQWCLVVHNGQRGYIYKTFIKRNLKEEAKEGTGLF